MKLSARAWDGWGEVSIVPWNPRSSAKRFWNMCFVHRRLRATHVGVQRSWTITQMPTLGPESPDDTGVPVGNGTRETPRKNDGVGGSGVVGGICSVSEVFAGLLHRGTPEILATQGYSHPQHWPKKFGCVDVMLHFRVHRKTGV